MQFGYNLLNLPSTVTSAAGGTGWARYAYLADGTKMYRKDMHHDGHIYRGSFVYRLEGGVQRLESIGYEEGRILATGHNDWGTAEEFIDTWHVTDHLGNVRAVVDITDIQRWTTPDPLSEKYYDLSPYAFCNNNPVNFVDPDGRFIISDNMQEWNDNKRKIENKVRLLQQKASELNHKGKSGKRLNKINERIKSLNHTLATMNNIEKSSQGYCLSQAVGEVGGVQYDISSSLVNISYIPGSTENFIHEVTHAGQFETGDIAFSPESGKTLAQDIYDEVAAYKAQKYYSGGNPDKITARYVQNIRDPKREN